MRYILEKRRSGKGASSKEERRNPMSFRNVYDLIVYLTTEGKREQQTENILTRKHRKIRANIFANS